MKPKKLPDKPFYSIPSHRITSLPAGNDPNSWTLLSVFRTEDDETLRVYPSNPIPLGKEIRSFEESKLLWQTVLLHPYPTLP